MLIINAQLEKWYSTPHENIGLLESDIENWKNVPLEEELTLPPPNPFIPDDFIILEVEGSDLPVQVTQSTGIKKYFSFYSNKLIFLIFCLIITYSEGIT